MRNSLTGLLFATIAGAACGCVQMYPTRSGYLTDYSQLVQVDKKDRVRANTVDAAALARIDSFYIEPVQWLADDMGQPASSPKNEAKLRNSMEMALVTELGSIRPIVNEEEIGPATARVRAAVTGVQEAKPFANLFMAVQIAGPLFNGGAVAEIEAINSQGEQIAAQSAAFYGWEWDFLGYFWRPAHPKTALKRFAKQFANELKVATVADPASGNSHLPPKQVLAAPELPESGGESRKGAQRETPWQPDGLRTGRLD